MVKKLEKLENLSKTPVPDAIRKQEIEDIINGNFPEKAIARIGENRGQLFVRIPKIVTKNTNLKKGGRLLFNVFKEKEKTCFNVEVVD